MLDNYVQPEFYHFSRDSVLLVDCAIDYINKKLSYNNKIIDLVDICSGCGIVGLEFFSKWNQKENMTLSFIEKNKKFEPFLLKNCENYNVKTYNAFFMEISGFKLQKKSLILSNPPYYIDGQGRAPSDEDKENCHFWCLEEFHSWKNILIRNLSLNGISIFSYRFNGYGLDELKNSLNLTEIGSIGDSRIFISRR